MFFCLCITVIWSLLFYAGKFKSLSLQDELEAELEELEGAELEEELLKPATTAPAAPVHVPAGPQRNRPTPKPTAEDDELAALQAEMAL